MKFICIKPIKFLKAREWYPFWYNRLARAHEFFLVNFSLKNHFFEKIADQ